MPIPLQSFQNMIEGIDEVREEVDSATVQVSSGSLRDLEKVDDLLAQAQQILRRVRNREESD